MSSQSHILLLGDTHGNPTALRDAFARAHDQGCEAIIQLGDFGYGWSVGPDGVCDFSYLAASMAEKTGIPFYWLDGNHENFDRLYALPLNEAGYRPILEGVTHLPRGSVITFGETTFMAFGGAYSVDKPHRKEGRSWWKQETPSQEDIDRAMDAGKVHILLTHDAPYGVQTEDEYAWLESVFGHDAVVLSQANQQIVRAVLDNCGATEVYHGHLHRTYTRAIPDTRTYVTCLNKDEDEGNSLILAV